MGHPHARWSALSTSQKTVAVAVGLAQVTLKATAYRDLARRPAEQVDGPKLAWCLAILVNWLGPIAYFARGRRAA